MLDGRGEAIQQRLTVRLGGLGKCIFDGQCLRELSTGPPQTAVHRRRAEQIRLVHIAEDVWEGKTSYTDLDALLRDLDEGIARSMAIQFPPFQRRADG